MHGNIFDHSGLNLEFCSFSTLDFCLAVGVFFVTLSDLSHDTERKIVSNQGFQSGPVPGTFTRLRSCIVPAEITEPPNISGGQNHKYDGR